MKRLVILIEIIFLWSNYALAQEVDDPYFWLEEVNGEAALAWVVVHNENTISAFKTNPAFDAIYYKNLEIYNSDERIDDVRINGDYIYNLLQDEAHELGIWRRASLISYVNGQPEWDLLLDLDTLAKSEGKNWVFRGAQFLSPANTCCMVRLSDRGSDAAEIREFDVERKTFVTDGFCVPLARRTYFDCKDVNTLYVATDFGEGSISQYGSPCVIKIWKRGTPLGDASVLFKGDTTDRIVFPMVVFGPRRTYDMVVQISRAGDRRIFSVKEEKLIRWKVPSKARIRHVGDQMVLFLQSDWQIGDKTYPQGALISIDFDDFLDGDRAFDIVAAPDARSHIWYIYSTYNFLLVSVLHDARSVLYRYRLQLGEWVPERISAPEHATMHLKSWTQTNNRFFFTGEGFLQPSTLYYVGEEGTVERVQSEREFFDPEPFSVLRHEAISRDGTRVPYFIVESRDMKFDGTNPTLLYGYGAVGSPQLPWYDPVVGTAWMERGGVYVVANIRGGGEFGPDWHQSAVRENRQRTFDDFIAVAEDLITRGITSPRHLGIMGHSGGGLLVGAVFVQRPDLFSAVACLNPVLDMKQSRLVEEYGDPDNPDDWFYMKKYSPYHNLSRERSYPKVLFFTSTTDDRVNPGHARKMAAKMEDMGHEVYFYETEEGGHGSAVTPNQEAFRDALIYTYLLEQLQ